jgi:hypothetical protein
MVEVRVEAVAVEPYSKVMIEVEVDLTITIVGKTTTLAPNSQ